MVGHLHYLWWWALDFAEDGDLSDIDPIDIAEEAMWEGDPATFVSALVDSGFLTKDLQIHDWSDYTGRLVSQRESNRERQKRHRDKKKAQPVVTVTPESEPVTVMSPLRNGATVPNRTQPNRTEEATASSPARERAEPVGGQRDKRKTRSTPMLRTAPAQELLAILHEDLLQIGPPTDPSRALSDARQLVEAGCDPDELRRIVRWLQAIPYWASSGINMGVVKAQRDKFLSAQNAPPTPVPKPGGSKQPQNMQTHGHDDNVDWFGEYGPKAASGR